MFYARFFDALNRQKIRYLVIGGLAVTLHGVVRLTLDIDILVDSSEDQSSLWSNVCHELKLSPRQPVTWTQMYSAKERLRLREEKNLIAFCLLSQTPEDPVIDIMFDAPIDFQTAWKRKKIQKIENADVPLISIEDLIAMKVAANRPKDLKDIEYLKKLL